MLSTVVLSFGTLATDIDIPVFFDPELICFGNKKAGIKPAFF
ncbi:hypothetical protein GW12_29310 [Acinetobacter sp. HR7]|nr:hypothetical protein GW12_29310 [Acinetobacter sp. HR7]